MKSKLRANVQVVTEKAKRLMKGRATFEAPEQVVQLQEEITQGASSDTIETRRKVDEESARLKELAELTAGVKLEPKLKAKAAPKDEKEKTPKARDEPKEEKAESQFKLRKTSLKAEAISEHKEESFSSIKLKAVLPTVTVEEEEQARPPLRRGPKAATEEPEDFASEYSIEERSRRSQERSRDTVRAACST